MNEEVSSAEFLKGLPKRLKVGVNVDESILSLGFHAWGGFNIWHLRKVKYQLLHAR